MGDSGVIPLRQKCVEYDGHVLLEVLSHFASRCIDVVQDSYRHRQPLLGVGLGHELANELASFENDALTGSRDMGEKAMFNGIVFGTVGGIMRDADFDAQLIDESL